VGHERTHAKLLGQGEGLAVVGCGLLVLQRLAPRRNVTEEAQSICLIASFLALADQCQRSLGAGLRLLQAVSQQLHLPQGGLQSASTLVAVVCASACVSSGMASATRPPRVYAAPKTAAIMGEKNGRSTS
jgi:hypothetical protein